jgi:hypothetical protein
MLPAEAGSSPLTITLNQIVNDCEILRNDISALGRKLERVELHTSRVLLLLSEVIDFLNSENSFHGPTGNALWPPMR